MIGIFDSGVGGLCALREARRQMPQADFVYLADEANLPYGDKSPATILRLARAATERLVAEGAEVILAACGTVSSVALPTLQAECPVPVLGILDPLAAAAAAASGGADAGAGGILLLGTRATVRAGVLEAKIRRLATHAPLYTLPCPGFVPLAEAGRCDPHDGSTVAAVADILRPVTGADIRAVALGCTHFSCLDRVIAAVLPKAAVIDGAKEAAATLARALPSAMRQGGGQTMLLTTGDPAALHAAARRYGIEG